MQSLKEKYNILLILKKSKNFIKIKNFCSMKCPMKMIKKQAMFRMPPTAQPAIKRTSPHPPSGMTSIPGFPGPCSQRPSPAHQWAITSTGNPRVPQPVPHDLTPLTTSQQLPQTSGQPCLPDFP